MRMCPIWKGEAVFQLRPVAGTSVQVDDVAVMRCWSLPISCGFSSISRNVESSKLLVMGRRASRFTSLAVDEMGGLGVIDGMSVSRSVEGAAPGKEDDDSLGGRSHQWAWENVVWAVEAS